ncbi:MAG: MFS transporter [Bacteroidetes bacterium]|nr:MFS transporter [Bacteroidota bacterium]
MNNRQIDSPERMAKIKIKLVLFINFFVIGILLNSVGIVILQVIEHYGVTKSSASILEAFKDLTIAASSFLLASYIPKYGYKKSMLSSLLIVGIACICMRFFGSFLMAKILFALTGFSFSLIKVSVYSTVGLITSDSNDHASLLSLLEGFFMVGVLSGYWLFGFFIQASTKIPGSLNNPQISWLDAYWVLALLCLISFLILLSTQLDERGAQSENFKILHEFYEMFALIRFPLVLVFVVSAFFYVLIEQSIQTWLPTFNKSVLQIPESISVQIVSILAASIAVGRIAGGYFIKKFNWLIVLTSSLIGAMLLVILVIPITRGIVVGSVKGWYNLPIAAYLLPLVGFFLGPIYPALNSSILSVLPKNRQSAMTGLIVIFSALGGTTGSLITGFIFGHFEGQTAFYFSLLPMSLLLLILFLYNKIRSGFHFKEA